MIQIEKVDFKKKNFFRPDRELLNSISEPDDDGLVQVLDIDGQDVNVGFLRPLSTLTSVLESHQIRESPGAEFETNRKFHPGKVQGLWNSAFRCHSVHKPECQGELRWMRMVKYNVAWDGGSDLSAAYAIMFRADTTCIQRYRVPSLMQRQLI